MELNDVLYYKEKRNKKERNLIPVFLFTLEISLGHKMFSHEGFPKINFHCGV